MQRRKRTVVTSSARCTETPQRLSDLTMISWPAAISRRFRAAADVLQGLIRPGAVVRRGERQQAVATFKGGARLVLEEARRAFRCSATRASGIESTATVEQRWTRVSTPLQGRRSRMPSRRGNLSTLIGRAGRTRRAFHRIQMRSACATSTYDGGRGVGMNAAPAGRRSASPCRARSRAGGGAGRRADVCDRHFTDSSSSFATMARAGLLPAMRVSALAGVQASRWPGAVDGARGGGRDAFPGAAAGDARASPPAFAHTRRGICRAGWLAPRGAVPNDPRISQQPALHNSPGGIDASAASGPSTGSTSVVVAIVDSDVHQSSSPGRMVPDMT